LFEGSEKGAAEELGELEGPVEGCEDGPAEGARLQLGWLEGEEEGPVEDNADGPELGAADTLGEERAEARETVSDLTIENPDFVQLVLSIKSSFAAYKPTAQKKSCLART
jgi:hypothetical protein